MEVGKHVTAEWAQLWAGFGMWIVGALAGILAWMALQLHRLALGMRELQVFRDSHEAADRETHARLADEGKAILAELRLARTESTEQHRELALKVDAVVADGRDERGRLHKRLDEIGAAVASVKGWIEGREKA